jgi:hypothetical protein
LQKNKPAQIKNQRRLNIMTHAVQLFDIQREITEALHTSGLIPTFPVKVAIQVGLYKAYQMGQAAGLTLSLKLLQDHYQPRVPSPTEED